MIGFQGANYTSPTGDPLSQSFNGGNSIEQIQNFPTRPTQPLAVYTEGFYGQDSWKAMPNLTINGGIRFEHSSNPICVTNCFSRLAGDVSSLTGSTLDTPYNQLIRSGQHQAFNSFQTIAVEPRAGFAYSPFGVDSKTVIRGGFGMFADTFPAVIVTSLDTNAPTEVGFTIYGAPMDPSVPGSASSLAASSNTAFQAGYASGGSFNSISASTPTFSAPTFTTINHKLFYPSYEEWSLQVEQQVAKSTSISVAYVGNHGYKEPVSNNDANAFGFFNLPAAQPIPSFTTITNVYSGASSNYNGLVASVVNRSRYLTLQFNYAYSHALDEISNGGLSPLGGTGNGGSLLGLVNPLNLASNYGNADYDARNNVTGSYVFTVPYKGGPRALTDGWEFAGTVFHHSGFPFSVVDSATSGSFAGNGFSSVLLADQLVGHLPRHCASIYKNDGSAVPCFTVAGTPGVTNPDFGPATAFAQGRRNAFTGPGYTDTDLSILKSFRIPGWESAKFTVGAQFFNLFNHPNFALPSGNISDSNFGLSTGNVNPPTSILGSFLGGDASPRLIQFKGSFTF